MIALLARLAVNAGLPVRAARPVVILILLALLAGAAWLAWTTFIGSVEDRGAAKVERRVERDHARAVSDARTDERQAQDAGDAIGASVVRADAATDHLLKTTIEDLRDALHQAPQPAPAGAPAASVADASMRGIDAALNAVVDRANRTAATAPAGPGIGEARDADAVVRPPQR